MQKDTHQDRFYQALLALVDSAAPLPHAEELKQELGWSEYLRECRTVTLKGPRRAGHTTAARRLAKSIPGAVLFNASISPAGSDPFSVIVVDNASRRTRKSHDLLDQDYLNRGGDPLLVLLG